MKASKKQGPDPHQKEKDTNKINPGKPNNDPDQTPERETKDPPVAEPGKQNKPDKKGFLSFSDTFLLY